MKMTTIMITGNLYWIFKKLSTLFFFFFLVQDGRNSIHPFEIIEIICINGNYKLIVEELKVEGFCKHLRSYRVGPSREILKVVSLSDVKHLPVNLHVTVEGLTYFRPKNV